METKIKSGSTVFTLINVFEVNPGKQQALIDLLIRATEETMRHQKGFISANIHRGLDGNKVVNYAQWASRTDFEAMLGNSDAQKHMNEARGMATNTPVFCEVVSVLHV